MSLKDQIVVILQERSFEIRDGASKMEVVEATDFEQIAMDILDLLAKEHGFEEEEK